MLVRSGIVLIKYWFSITDEEQHLQFNMRIRDPLKQWKLSPMEVEARTRWEQYTKAKEAMLEHTHIAEAPWHLVQAVDKKKARLNCIRDAACRHPYRCCRIWRRRCICEHRCAQDQISCANHLSSSRCLDRRSEKSEMAASSRRGATRSHLATSILTELRIERD